MSGRHRLARGRDHRTNGSNKRFFRRNVREILKCVEFKGAGNIGFPLPSLADSQERVPIEDGGVNGNLQGLEVLTSLLITVLKVLAKDWFVDGKRLFLREEFSWEAAHLDKRLMKLSLRQLMESTLEGDLRWSGDERKEC